MKKHPLITVVAVCVAVAILVALERDTQKVQAVTGSLTAHQIAERNKPGVVMMYTVWKTHVVVPEPALDQSRVPLLTSRAQASIRRGEFPATKQGLTTAMIREVLVNLLDYVKPGKKLVKKDVETGAMGTGFIITPDGYIVTNAHVVYAEEDYLKWQLTQTALKEIIAKDVEDVINEAGELDVEVSQETMDTGVKNASIYYKNEMQLDKIETQIFTEMGVAVPGLQAMQRGFGSDIRKRGEPIPGKDVAILKIDKTNLPTVSIGDDSSMTTGDKVYVMGYPAAATFHDLLSAESAIEPTMTSGLISARKTMQGGWDVLQTDAAITHGNSGGPAFNEMGQVIGIATFGSIDYQTGAEVAGMNFLIPINIAKQFLHEMNVTPTESNLTKTYIEGLTYFDNEQYSRALEKFREVNELNPGYPYVQQNISSARTSISEGRDRSSVSTWVYIVIGAAIVLLCLGLAVGFYIIRLRSRATRQKPNVPAHP